MDKRTNDQIILDQLIDQRRSEIGGNFSDDEFFEIFSAEQLLKDYDLSYDELLSGIVAGGNDGGIDSMYTLVNGELVVEDTDLGAFKRDLSVDVVFIQSKATSGFKEEPINKFTAAVRELLDLSIDLDSLATVYNEELRDCTLRFRDTYTKLAGRFPKLQIHFVYATKGTSVHDNVSRKVPTLKDLVKGLYSNATVRFDFVGAPELLTLSRERPSTSFQLKFVETPIISTGAVGFICIVKLRDYFAFITDDEHQIRRSIFEANVRDYQGNVQVNSDIQESLRGNREEEFWWLNNGVTIVASNAALTGKEISIENPFIVNGLQTSTEIFNYFSEANTEGDERCLRVKVVVPGASQSRDRIIKATNFQTAIPGISLRATEKIHRDIEDYLRDFGVFYDRRKNYYKNEGKPIDKIISIGQLSQAVLSILLQQPDDARARPSSIIKDEENYRKVFDPDYPIEIYRVCALLLKRIAKIVKQPEIGLKRNDRNNLAFFVAMYTAMDVTGDVNPSAKKIAAIDVSAISDDSLADIIARVDIVYRGLGGIDQVAKSKEFTNKLIERWKEEHS